MKKKLRLLYVPTEQANRLIQTFIRLCKKKKTIHNRLYKIFVRNKLQKKFSILIGDCCNIGKNLYCPHPQNIVIGERVKIGNDCVVYQDVTIGQNKGLYPELGDDVIIYPGAKIFGGIKIGSKVVIGANSVVSKNVEPNTIVAGVPARVIGKVKNEDKYY